MRELNIPFLRTRESRILFLLFILTLSIRLAFISQKNLWFYEIYSWHLSRQSFLSIIFTTWSDIHPPLFYFMLKGWIWVLGDSVTALRILPVLCCSLSIFFIYPISRRILNVQNTFLVIILYALSPLNLFYSQEVRMAAVNLFFNLGSSYYLIKIIETSRSNSQNEVQNNILLKYRRYYILFAVLSLYTHYF